MILLYSFSVIYAILFVCLFSCFLFFLSIFCFFFLCLGNVRHQCYRPWESELWTLWIRLKDSPVHVWTFFWWKYRGCFCLLVVDDWLRNWSGRCIWVCLVCPLYIHSHRQRELESRRCGAFWRLQIEPISLLIWYHYLWFHPRF